jgi:hypothetical protein
LASGSEGRHPGGIGRRAQGGAGTGDRRGEPSGRLRRGEPRAAIRVPAPEVAGDEGGARDPRHPGPAGGRGLGWRLPARPEPHVQEVQHADHAARRGFRDLHQMHRLLAPVPRLLLRRDPDRPL